MKKLEYNTKSWHSRLYMSTYGLDRSELPDNICAYFWKLLLAIVLFIPSYIGHIVNLFVKNEQDRIPAGVTSLITLFTTVFGIPFLENDAFTYINIIKSHFLGILVVLTATSILIVGGLIGMGVDYLYKKFKRSSKLNPSTNPIKEGFKAFKGKYCSKIEWTNK